MSMKHVHEVMTRLKPPTVKSAFIIMAKTQCMCESGLSLKTFSTHIIHRRLNFSVHMLNTLSGFYGSMSTILLRYANSISRTTWPIE